MLRGLRGLVAVLGLFLGSQALGQTATYVDLAKESTATVGTGTLTVGGAVSGYLTFEDAGVGNGNTVSYGIVDGTSREAGRGVYNVAANTLTRCVGGCTAVVGGVVQTTAINLSGSAQVGLTAISTDFDDLWTGVNAVDLDFTDDAGTAGLAITEAETLTIAGDTAGIDTAGSGNTLTISFDVTEAEANIESAIDTLANLTSIQGFTVTYSDPGADAIFGWDDSTNAWEALTRAEVQAVIGDIALGTETSGNYVAEVADGTGIDGACASEGCTYTPTLDLTEISSATLGAGSFTTLTFDAGATDPVLTASSGKLTLTTGGFAVTGNDGATTYDGIAEQFLLETTSPSTMWGQAQAAYSNDAIESGIAMFKSRNASIGGHTIVQNNDNLGSIYAYGSDGTNFEPGAAILFAVDGTPASAGDTTDMPGRIVFRTTTDGSDSITSRWIIDNAGVLKPFADGTYDIGTTALGVNNLFLDTGAVINFEAGDVTMTHSSNTLTITGGVTVLDNLSTIGGSTFNMADNNLDQVLAWDDSAGQVIPIPLATLTDEASPASGDYVLIYGAEGDLRKANWSTLPGVGGGISNVVEDTTPQLGGFLDWNGQTMSDATLTDTLVLDLGENLLSLTNDAAGATGVVLKAQHDSASPALDDVPFDLQVFAGADDEEIGRIAYHLIDGATTTEDGDWRFYVDVAGTSAVQASVGNGVIIGTGTTFPGAGNLRVTSIELGDDTANTLTASAGALSIEGVALLPDSSGSVDVTNLATDSVGADELNIGDAESEIEGAIDTLANLTSIQGLTVTLADAGADAVFGWDDSAAAYENLTASEVRTAIGLATTDSPEFTALNIGAASDTTLARSAAGEATLEGDAIKHAGKQMFWVGAGAMKNSALSPASCGDAYDSGTQDVSIYVCAFDTGATEENAEFGFAMPKASNESTITMQFAWTNTGGASTQTVQWKIACTGFGDDDALNTAYPADVTVSDTWTAQNDYQLTAETGAITIQNLAEGDYVNCRIGRDTSADNMAGDALLIGAKVYWTDDASTLAE